MKKISNDRDLEVDTLTEYFIFTCLIYIERDIDI